jgi:hypothetical protein
MAKKSGGNMELSYILFCVIITMAAFIIAVLLFNLFFPFDKLFKKEIQQTEELRILLKAYKNDKA